MGLCPASLFFVFVSASHSSFKVTYVSACTASGAGESFVVFLLCVSKKKTKQKNTTTRRHFKIRLSYIILWMLHNKRHHHHQHESWQRLVVW